MTAHAIAEVRRCEDELAAAMLAGDVARLDTLVDDSLVFTLPDGSVIDKPTDLATHGEGSLRLAKLAIVQRQFHDCDGAIVSTVRAQLEGIFHGAPFAGTYAYTRVWMHRNGRWSVVAGHAAAL